MLNMPDKCCGTGCRGNHDPTKEYPAFEKVSVFKFPKDIKMRKRWERLIPRENLIINANTVECEKHFSPQFIIRIDSITRDNGTILSVPRTRSKLTADAIPTYFPNTASYLSSEPPTKRKNPDNYRAEMYARDDDNFNDWLASDGINSFNDFNDKIDEYIKEYSSWIFVKTGEFICLLTVNFNDILRIATSIKINKDLQVDVYKGGLKLETSSLSCVLDNECKLDCRSKLASLLSHYKYDFHSNNIKEYVGLVEHSVNDLSELLKSCDE